MDNSPLSKLPPELQNDIYELALLHDGPIILYGDHDSKRWRSEDGHLNLALTCTTLHTQTVQMAYSINSFEFHIAFRAEHWHRLHLSFGRAWSWHTYAPAPPLRSFFETIGPLSTRSMRSVVFCAPGDLYDMFVRGEDLADFLRIGQCSNLTGAVRLQASAITIEMLCSGNRKLVVELRRFNESLAAGASMRIQDLTNKLSVDGPMSHKNIKQELYVFRKQVEELTEKFGHVDWSTIVF